jgi:hypothetical protein
MSQILDHSWDVDGEHFLSFPGDLQCEFAGCELAVNLGGEHARNAAGSHLF